MASAVGGYVKTERLQRAWEPAFLTRSWVLIPSCGDPMLRTTVSQQEGLCVSLHQAEDMGWTKATFSGVMGKKESCSF